MFAELKGMKNRLHGWPSFGKLRCSEFLSQVNYNKISRHRAPIGKWHTCSLVMSDFLFDSEWGLYKNLLYFSKNIKGLLIYT
jgi:hypothetical protein